MAELSADTQAILNALTEQGKLLRNDGRTNSIKTVNIRFIKAFAQIIINRNPTVKDWCI